MIRALKAKEESAGGSNVVPMHPVHAPAYKPTNGEGKALKKLERRRASRNPLPAVKSTVEQSEEGLTNVNLGVDHKDEDTGYKLIAEALSSEHDAFTSGMLDAATRITRTPGRVSEEGMNFALAFVAGIKPRDQLEAALGMQMAAIHRATITAAEKLCTATRHEMADVHEKALNRLARTFAAQTEALKRLRNKGEQRIFVERVNVSEGGQAIVSNVGRGLGSGGEV